MAAEFSVSDLVDALDKASDDIKREAGRLIETAAVNTRDKVQVAFPVGPTGRLRRSVSLGRPRSFAASTSGVVVQPRLVRAFAPHVHIWQEGTVDRYDATRGNAYRGKSPRHGRVFEAIAARERAEMYRQMQALVDRKREL